MWETIGAYWAAEEYTGGGDAAGSIGAGNPAQLFYSPCNNAVSFSSLNLQKR